MATTYKSLSTNDIVTTKTLLHEAIPITGTIVSGTYKTGDNEHNIKNYTHAMFQSVYDYPYLSSSANHIFDISAGVHSTSFVITASNGTGGYAASGRTGLHQGLKKQNIYNQMAQVLMGYDSNNNIRLFDADGDLNDGGTKIKEAIFINFSRLVTKDEIKKGSFEMQFGVAKLFTPTHANSSSFSSGTLNNGLIKVYDKNAQNDYRVNSPAGDYGILYASSSNAATLTNNDNANSAVGLVYYQAGIAVLDAGLFHNSAGISGSGDAGNTPDNALSRGLLKSAWLDPYMNASGTANAREMGGVMVSASIPDIATAVRHRMYNIQFNNTTELNSTVYFCRAHHNEFNYSTNPTYLSGSKLVVKNDASNTPVSYITTVGLYSADNELLAVAKVSEPLKKDPSNELTLRVRLDY
mgnify:CR=1 FL=1